MTIYNSFVYLLFLLLLSFMSIRSFSTCIRFANKRCSLRSLQNRCRPLFVETNLAMISNTFQESSTNAATNNFSTMSEMKTTSYPIEMSDDEKYLFDLNGYLIIKGVLNTEEVILANKAIDNHIDQAIERKDVALRNAVKGTALYGSGPGRKDLGRVLEWGTEDSVVFKSILAHPRLVPLFHGIIGKGYRMDHLPFVIMQDTGAEGFQLHGGSIDCTSGEYNPHLAYTCNHNMIRTALLGCNVMLTDHNSGDGGFCVVPGSHKSNFKMPKKMLDGELYKEFIQQPVTKAGDVVLFSEGTVHGAMPWTTNERQRRVCLYRFGPATNCYGRSYFGHGNDDNDDPNSNNGMKNGWPTTIYDDLTDAQRAVLEPPYADRLDRPIIQSDGSVQISSRSPRKKQHDMDLFGTEYF